MLNTCLSLTIIIYHNRKLLSVHTEQTVSDLCPHPLFVSLCFGSRVVQRMLSVVGVHSVYSSVWDYVDTTIK